jgi:hypothetical protein
MATTQAIEGSDVHVRVNPANIDLTPDNPDYIATREKDRIALQAIHLERIKSMIEAGELELPSGPAEHVGDLMQRSPEFLAHAIAERDMTLRAALGGHGLVGMCELNYHGVNIIWTPDESVPVGDFRLEDDNPREVMAGLAVLRPL